MSIVINFDTLDITIGNELLIPAIIEIKKREPRKPKPLITKQQIIIKTIVKKQKIKKTRKQFVEENLKSHICEICNGKYSTLGKYSYFKHHEKTMKHQNALNASII